MAQTVCFVWCNGVLRDKVFHDIPSHNDFVEICREIGLKISSDYDYISIDYEKVEINSGESEFDMFIPDDELIFLRNTMDWDKLIKEIYGYDVDLITAGFDAINYNELN